MRSYNVMRPIGQPLLLAILMTSVALPAVATEAANSDLQIEAIVVTARKRDENLQSIPATITALPAGAIRDAHITKFEDLGFLVPNLNITTRADNTPDVVMRGVGAFGVTEGVGFYANDVQLFEGQTVRIEDLERIEVLRGPQGTLYGGNNIGGAIKYITKKPSDILTAEARAEFGNLNTRNFSGAISGPLGNGLKARLSAYDATHDGFVFDSTLNRYLGHTNQKGGRLTLTYDNEDTNVAFYLYGTRQRGDNHNLYYAAASDNSFSRVTTANVPPHYNIDLYAPSLRIDHQFADVARLTSISSYFHSKIDARADGDHRAAPIFDVTQNATQKVWSQELRLASVSTTPVEWLIGAFIQERTGDKREANTQFLSFLTGDPADDFTGVSASHHIQREYAVFGNISYTANALTVEAGARLEHFKNSLTDTINLVTGNVSGTQILPRASVSYHFNPDVMTYITVTEGLQPADILQSHGSTSAFDSEKTWNYEGGLKSTLFDRRLQFNLSAFYIKYKNRLFNTIDGQTLEEVTKNVGPSHNYGFEGDIELKATSELTLKSSFGITKAKWENIPGFYNPNTGQIINLDGLTAPYTPAYQATLTAEWAHHFTDQIRLSTRAAISFRGANWWNISDDYKQRPYKLVNLGARLTLNDHLEIAADVKNLFDVQYHTAYAGGPDIGSPFNTGGFSLPREWFLSTTVKF